MGVMARRLVSPAALMKEPHRASECRGRPCPRRRGPPPPLHAENRRSEQRTTIKEYIVKERVKPTTVCERLAVGATLPADVELHTVPSAWGPHVSAVRGASRPWQSRSDPADRLARRFNGAALIPACDPKPLPQHAGFAARVLPAVSP